MSEQWSLRCLKTDKQYSMDYQAPYSPDGGLLEVIPPASSTCGLDFSILDQRLISRDKLDNSGVWRFREWILPLSEEEMVSRGEGNTNLYDSHYLSEVSEHDQLFFKHEGENPTGSFKDRGMCTATSMAKKFGFQAVACASTGNTSASMASFARVAGLRPLVFLPAGKIALGKISQALAYGATILEIQGSFDDALVEVQKSCEDLGIYLMNSINPFRLEGQKAIFFEILQQLNWKIPDWIVLPGGNLGNISAIGKAARELKNRGLISKLPRFCVVQAQGANPFFEMMEQGLDQLQAMEPETFATAIRIGNPVSWQKAFQVLKDSDGVVLEVSESEIVEAKFHVDRSGIGAEPASCVSFAGLKQLKEKKLLKENELAVCILTGHLLKDPGANQWVQEESRAVKRMLLSEDAHERRIQIEKALQES